MSNTTLMFAHNILYIPLIIFFSVSVMSVVERRSLSCRIISLIFGVSATAIAIANGILSLVTNNMHTVITDTVNLICIACTEIFMFIFLFGGRGIHIKRGDKKYEIVAGVCAVEPNNENDIVRGKKVEELLSLYDLNYDFRLFTYKIDTDEDGNDIEMCVVISRKQYKALEESDRLNDFKNYLCAAYESDCPEGILDFLEDYSVYYIG